MRKWQGFNIFCSNEWASEFNSGALWGQQVTTQTVNTIFWNGLCNILNREKHSAVVRRVEVSCTVGIS